MKIIEHRINTLEALRKLDQVHGAEIDIRSNGDTLYLNHDPFGSGDLLEEWLNSYSHGTLILNTKEEGLETRISEMLARRNIKDYFFLDLSFPFLIKTALSGESKIAVRFSEYESIKTVERVANIVDWIWLDSFHSFSYNARQIQQLSNLGMNVCIVSPELQGRWDVSEICQIKKIAVKALGDNFYVCTKSPALWM